MWGPPVSDLRLPVIMWRIPHNNWWPSVIMWWPRDNNWSIDSEKISPMSPYYIVSQSVNLSPHYICVCIRIKASSVTSFPTKTGIEYGVWISNCIRQIMDVIIHPLPNVFHMWHKTIGCTYLSMSWSGDIRGNIVTGSSPVIITFSHTD